MKNSKIIKIISIFLATVLIYIPTIVLTRPIMTAILYSGNDSENYFLAHLVHGIVITAITYFSVGMLCKYILKSESSKFKSMVILSIIIIERIMMFFFGIQIYILSGGDILHAARFPEMENGHWHIFPFFTLVYIFVMPILGYWIASKIGGIEHKIQLSNE